MNDEELVLKIQNGDREKFKDIVKRYEGKLFGYIRKLINQRDEEVEDLLQEVFISCYVNLQGFDSKKRFSSWIYRIAHNKAVDYFKKKKIKTTTIEDKEEFWQSKDKLIEELEIDKETNKEIRRAVNKLELKYKEVILLYFFERKSYEEISEILHTPTSHVGVWLSRAKEKLKKELSKRKI